MSINRRQTLVVLGAAAAAAALPASPALDVGNVWRSPRRLRKVAAGSFSRRSSPQSRMAASGEAVAT